MSGTSNFQQWNPGAANQETDAQYTSDALRTGGASDPAAFPSVTANKLFYQLSTFAAAFAQAMANKGYTISDASLTNLSSALANVMTEADMAPYAPLAAPTFSGLTTANAIETTGIDASAVAQIRINYNNCSVLLRNDGSFFYVLMTPVGSPLASFTAARPLQINLSTGAVSIDQGGAGTVFGAAPTFPTRSLGDNTLAAANTNFVTAAINAYAAYVAGTYAPLVSPGFSGVVNMSGGAITIGPPGGLSDNSTRVPNTAWVQSLFANSLSANGYQKLPGGLILQWGLSGTINSGTSGAVGFPITFPNACLQRFVTYTNNATVNSPGIGNPFNVYVAASPTAQFFIYNGGSSGAQYMWFAVGY